MTNDTNVQALCDADLLQGLHRLLAQSRRVEADLVAHIGEVDTRRLFLQEAAPSMYVYCTTRLHLSEAEAYLRIEAARAARRHPRLLELLRSGRLHLSGLAKLAPHLTAENCDAVLAQAEGRSKREIEELVARLKPRPDIPVSVRKLPEPTASPSPAATLLELRPDGAPQPAPPPAPKPAPRAPVMEPLAPARYRVEFTASAGLRDKLDQLLGLMRTADHELDLAGVIEQAVSEKLERLLARRFAITSQPRQDLRENGGTPTSRYVPAAVRRAVYTRDGGQCGFIDRSGRRCPERSALEFHHLHPFGYGGEHSPANVSLRCRSHNRYLTEQDYGREAMTRHVATARAANPREPAP